MNYDLIISAYRPYFIQARTLLEKYVLMVHTFLLAVGIAWVYRIRLYHRHSPPGPFGNNVKPLEYFSILTRPCSSGIFSIDQIQCQKSFWNQNPAYVHKLCAMLENFTQKYGNVVMFRSWGGVVNVFINSPEDIAFVLSANTPTERFGKDPLAAAQFRDLLGKPRTPSAMASRPP